MHYHTQFSDGGVKSFVRDMLPEIGRCQTCSFIVENIFQLEPVTLADELTSQGASTWQKLKIWISALLSLPSATDEPKMEWKYTFLPVPTFHEYAELFTVGSDVVKKRKRAIQACREFHHQFFLSPQDKEAIYRHEGYRLQTALEQRKYNEIADYLLTHRIEPTLDEYTLLCADILRMKGEFSKALEQYALVKSTELGHVVELGSQACNEQNVWLIRLGQ